MPNPEVRLKTRRLPDTDHANVALLNSDERFKRLRRMKAGRPPFSYKPTRNHESCLLNAQPSLPISVPDTDWETVARLVTKDCGNNPDGVVANLDVSKLLYDYVREHGIVAWQKGHGGFPLSIGVSLRYWLNAVLVQDGQLIIAGTDFRRSGGYTKAGLKFACSVMHEHIRAQNPKDFGEARLAMFRFPQEPKEDRTIHLEFWDESPLLSYDEIVQLSLETYATWGEVLEEQAQDARRTGTGGWWDGRGPE